MSKEISIKAEEKALTPAERFMNKVMTEFIAYVGETSITDFQRRLIQNYFISIDTALKTAEVRRLKDKKPDKEQLPCTWNNVDMDLLKVDTVRIARLGLDPAQSNHISFIPFKNNATGKYTINFIVGYSGKEHNAKKFALDMPLNVDCNLVFTNDIFKVVRKDIIKGIEIEHYTLDVTDEFDRGDIKGGFAYFIYSNPEKNVVKTMELKDILKRKPKYASVEFWGGEKDIWKDGKKTGKTEQVEGWYKEMCLKTVKRWAYGSITLDPQKVDDSFQYLKNREMQMVDNEMETEIAENANTIEITANVVDTEEGEITDNEGAGF